MVSVEPDDFPCLYTVGQTTLLESNPGCNVSTYRLVRRTGILFWRRYAVLAVLDHRRTRQEGGGQSPPWIWETSKIRADGMGNSGIQGTEFF